LDARTGKIASLLRTVVAQASVVDGILRSLRRASHRALTHRTHPTTRRLSRLPCPPCRHGPASRRPDLGGCDSDRRGRNLPSLGLAGSSRRWAIRWAKPCRIGPYQAQRRVLTFATVCLICRHFVAWMPRERHASHARGRWFETSRAHQKLAISRHYRRRAAEFLNLEPTT
jgi:hypothetical protein